VNRFDGLDDVVAAALGRVPVDTKAQLELAVRWPAADGAAARVASRLRVRVLTWDPTGWVEDDEPVPTVAVEGTGRDYRITLYVGAWTLDEPVTGTVARELTALADSIVRVGARNEASLIDGEWSALEEEGLVPPLLGALRLDPGVPAAEIELVEDWRPIDAPTVASIVAADFGPLELDLSPRRLSTPGKPTPGCPACAGQEYSVPFELDRGRPAMCPPHRADALVLMARVVGRAEDANSDAWEVFCHAAADLLPAPHVPYPIRNRLVDAVNGVHGYDEESSLSEQTEALLAFLEWAATPDRHEAAMWDLGWRPIDGPAREDGHFDDFAHHVAYRLGAAGDFDAAGRVVDALVPVIPHAAANLHGELATQLAEAGLIDEAGARIGRALDHPSRNLLTEIYAGEVDEHAGDPASAEARYLAALARSRSEGDTLFEHDILWHLVELLQDDDDRAAEVARWERERDQAHALHYSPTGPATPARSADTEEFGRKVGRNEPCPCGSGRKFKRCHGGG
jgi:hypothetical protein